MKARCIGRATDGRGKFIVLRACGWCWTPKEQRVIAWNGGEAMDAASKYPCEDCGGHKVIEARRTGTAGGAAPQVDSQKLWLPVGYSKEGGRT